MGDNTGKGQQIDQGPLLVKIEGFSVHCSVSESALFPHICLPNILFTVLVVIVGRGKTVAMEHLLCKFAMGCNGCMGATHCFLFTLLVAIIGMGKTFAMEHH